MKRIVSLIACMIMIIYSMPLFAAPFSASLVGLQITRVLAGVVPATLPQPHGLPLQPQFQQVAGHGLLQATLIFQELLEAVFILHLFIHPMLQPQPHGK